jgi:methylated-DNA-[protein]-cysteine S-methyltransferase
MTFEQHHFLAPIGWLEITATTDAITKLQIVPAPKQQLHSNNDIIIQCCNELKEYFEGKRKKFEVKVLYNGTIFQNNVWNQLQTIPYSTTIPYKTLAQMTGHPKA